MKISRRDFMKVLSVGLAGGYLGLKTGDSLAGGMGGGGCGGGGSTSVIDPPPGAAFADPAILLNESVKSGVVEVSIEAKVRPSISMGRWPICSPTMALTLRLR